MHSVITAVIKYAAGPEAIIWAFGSHWIIHKAGPKTLHWIVLLIHRKP